MVVSECRPLRFEGKAETQLFSQEALLEVHRNGARAQSRNRVAAPDSSGSMPHEGPQLWHSISLWGFLWFFFWSCCTAREIPVPQPRMEPKAPAVETQNPNYWTIREVPPCIFITCYLLPAILDKKNKLIRLRKIRNGSRKSGLQFNIRLANILTLGDM